MAYHGTIEVYAKEGATKGHKRIEGSFYTKLIGDIGQLPADSVIENILKHVQTSLKKYKSINTGSIGYDATDNPETIIHIIFYSTTMLFTKYHNRRFTNTLH